jgi:hypothetical protein
MIEINLLPEELRVNAKAQKQPAAQGQPGGFVFNRKYIVYAIPLVVAVIILAHIVLGGLMIWKSVQSGMLSNNWKSLEPQRKELEQFDKEFAVLTQDVSLLQKLTRDRISWSQKFSKLSLTIPSGMWFDEISLAAQQAIISGSVVSLQQDAMAAIREFMDQLKGDQAFFKYFDKIELSSYQGRTTGGYNVIDFMLVATLKAEK